MSDRSIREAISILAGTHKMDKVYSVTAEVISINITARTCVCIQISGSASTTINDVLIMASVDDGFLIIPTVGSTVHIITSEGMEPYISQYSAIDKIIFRGGDLGGLVMIQPLINKLNTLENKLNDLMIKYNAHVHPVVSVGAPTGPCSILETGPLTPTILNDLENKNITHG